MSSTVLTGRTSISYGRSPPVLVGLAAIGKTSNPATCVGGYDWVCGATREDEGPMRLGSVYVERARLGATLWSTASALQEIGAVLVGVIAHQ